MTTAKARPEAKLAYVEEAIRILKEAPKGSQRPQTDDELHAWIVDTLGIDIPRTSVCATHDAPFDFIADMFFHRVTDAVVLANRGGGKTMYIAVLHVLNGYWKAGFTTSHFGAISEQARRAYSYFKTFTRKKVLKNSIKDSLQSVTNWTNGSTIEVLAGTEKQTQGAHSRLVAFDELESGNPIAYENSKAIPTEWWEDDINHLGQYVVTSTRNTGTGLMQKALDEAEANGTRIYTWCVLETARPCTAECNAEVCDIFRWSDGRSRNATGWLSHEMVAKFRAKVSEETWECQFLCKKPESKSFVYSVFGDANISEAAEFDPTHGGIWLGYDWGYSDATALVLCQYYDGALWQFDELVGGGVSEQEWTERLVQRITELPGYEGLSAEQWQQVWKTNNWVGVTFPDVWVELGAGDPSAVQLRTELKQRGLPAAKPASVKHPVVSGQDVLRALMQPGPLGKPRYVVHPRCTQTIAGFQRLRSIALPDGSFGDRPDPSADNHRWSHTCDALRYLAWKTRRRFGLGGLTDDES